EDTLAAGPDPPTRAQVTVARRRRDDALDALSAPADAGDDRGGAVRDGIRTADELADARADHAEAAAARDRLERDRVALKTAREQLAAGRAAVAVREDEFAQRWVAAWPGLPEGPRTPEEMREWHANRSETLATLRAAREEDAAAARIERAIEQHRSALSEALGTTTDPVEAPSSLAAILRRARSVFGDAAAARSDHEQHERERERLNDELADARDRVEASETALAEWRTAWKPVTE